MNVEYKPNELKRPVINTGETETTDVTNTPSSAEAHSEEPEVTPSTSSSFAEQFKNLNREWLSSRPQKKTVTQPASGNNSPISTTADYEDVWKAYLEESPGDIEYKDLLDRLAKQESGFRNIQNTAGAGAYGYFQLWADNFKDTSGEQLLNDPVSQIRHAVQLMKNNIATFTQSDWELGKSLGYTRNAMLAGAWLGGVGGVRNYIKGIKDASDGHHYADGQGESVSKRMSSFNYKDGGELSPLLKLKIKGKEYFIKVAITEEEKMKGLSKIKSLPKNEGMLFHLNDDDLSTNGAVVFTMEDTHVPLDIIFLDDDYTILMVKEGIPLSKEPVVGRGAYVLELPAGSGVGVGDEIEFSSQKEVSSKMLVLDSEGNTQMELEGGERIFSIKNTKVLIKFAKKADSSQNDNDYKALGVRVFRFLKTQNEAEPEYVSN